MADERVAIAGAGPAGLVAARHLAASGLDVDVYEAADSVGGRIGSREVDGFTLDRGFQVLLTGYPAVQRELDLDALDLRAFAPGAVLCRRGQRSILADPLGDPGALTETLFNREVTTRDKLRLWRLRRELAETSRGAIFSGRDRTIHEALLDRGFSEGFVESFARPFVGGITLDSSLSTSARVFEYVLKVIAAGETAVPAGGMSAIPAQLAERADAAGARIHTGTPVERVSTTRSTATLEVGGGRGRGDRGRVRADAAIVATDPLTARQLTDVDAIPTEGRSSVTQYYTVPEPVAPDGERLHLDAEGGSPTHLVTLSNVAPEYAQEDDATDARGLEDTASNTTASDAVASDVAAADGGASDDSASDAATATTDGDTSDDRALISATFLDALETPAAKLDDCTRRSLAAWYPERHFGDLELLATDRVEFAQFAQPPGVHDRLPDVDAPSGRCYLAGEYTRWSSLQGALESGRTAAQHVLADL